ncbi:efflux RND transporter periplasmic adaptor subunit [Rhodocytophaga aerolata]|uniref:Efflux RND transporter periplasmic adaptor subunit n=1 Tax=Rhodocytophaga aerolata TaxID=455078 RepID=A0ABT8RC13_9BACT|nr:efflux RND transporter periplasmic adaptor subunit [Rhodocytophaga aerolata]MDO1449231.1 efflux RND transporter periplasmic adaptor subunit [Rhodocytophaga aerolata]
MERLKKYTLCILTLLSMFSWSCNREQGHDHTNQTGQEEAYYTCPMHPTVRSEEPGSCPVCGMDLVKKNAQNATPQANRQEESYYTCPMHPTVRSQTAGNCPICGMDLVKKEAGQSHENMIHLTERQQLLINLGTDTAGVKNMHENNLLLGTVAQDEKSVQVISARVRGRIEKLYVRNPGERINKGQLLYALYSEELLAVQTDFIQSLKQSQKFASQKEILDQLIEAARNKLLLWGMSEKQIAELSKAGKPSPYSSFYSQASGYLADLKITEGVYVEEGMPLFEIANLSSLWIEAQVYPQEFTILKQNPTLIAEFESLPGKKYTAKPVFSAPALEENQKIGLVRFAIQNPDEQIKPGMMAYIRLSHGGKEALVIPKSALLLEQMKIVWVEGEKGMFERRMVTTGIENKREVEILSGIEAGERVVSSGAYLLNSEFVLQQGGAQKHTH